MLMPLAGDKNVRKHFHPLSELNVVGTTGKVLNTHTHA